MKVFKLGFFPNIEVNYVLVSLILNIVLENSHKMPFSLLMIVLIIKRCDFIKARVYITLIRIMWLSFSNAYSEAGICLDVSYY